MLAVNGHAKHRQSLCRVGYGKTALSMDLFFITTENILSTHTFLLLSPGIQVRFKTKCMKKIITNQPDSRFVIIQIYLLGKLIRLFKAISCPKAKRLNVP